MDPTVFTPWSALAGGALIGLAAALLLAANGRIAGVSGIFGAWLEAPRGAGWQLAFIGGIISGSAAALALGVGTVGRSGLPLWIVMPAGLAVGFGTRMGSGCTSGHGVCGVGRLSMRSLVATLAFVAAGMATVYGVRHVFA